MARRLALMDARNGKATATTTVNALATSSASSADPRRPLSLVAAQLPRNITALMTTATIDPRQCTDETGGYIRREVGNCGSHLFIENQEDCAAAAEALGLKSMAVLATTNSPGDTDSPYGCYFEVTTNLLYFNPYGTRLHADDEFDVDNRASICGKSAELAAMHLGHSTRLLISVPTSVPTDSETYVSSYDLFPFASSLNPRLHHPPGDDQPGGTMMFDAYSPPFETLYSQVWWAGLPPLPLPHHVIQQFSGGKIMAIVGFECDQVRPRPTLFPFADGKQPSMENNRDGDGCPALCDMD